MATQKTILITLDSAGITKKQDKVALSYREIEIRTIYLDLKKFGSDFSAGDRILVEVIEKENADKTKRLEILNVQKL